MKPGLMFPFICSVIISITSCSTISKIQVTLPNHPQEDTGHKDILMAKVEVVKFQNFWADAAIRQVFKEFEKQGYKMHVLYNNREAFKRSLKKLKSFEMHDCKVDMVISSILQNAELGYTIQKFGLAIYCIESLPHRGQKKGQVNRGTGSGEKIDKSPSPQTPRPKAQP